MRDRQPRAAPVQVHDLVPQEHPEGERPRITVENERNDPVVALRVGCVDRPPRQTEDRSVPISLDEPAPFHPHSVYAPAS